MIPDQSVSVLALTDEAGRSIAALRPVLVLAGHWENNPYPESPGGQMLTAAASDLRRTIAQVLA